MGLDCGCYARVSDDDPRSKDWTAIMGEPVFPLRHPLLEIATIKLGGQEPYDMRIYAGDPERLTDEQKERMITLIQQKFGVPRETILNDMKTRGFPIKAENVTVTICQRHTAMLL